MRRGALIMFEGCDRTGKSTQSRLLYNTLLQDNHPVKHMSFPARESTIGQVINSYLTNQQELSDETIHLLFSANRWEYKNEMKKLLEAGTTFIVDRYSYSGVAYSVAKGLNYDWCISMEKGLLRPDAVFYLNAPIEQLQDRGNFGDERYEKLQFQRKVLSVYEDMMAKENINWIKIDAVGTKESIFENIYKQAKTIIKESVEKPIDVLT
ncbi:thymidylate kinase-like [Teleopsis dalmanni]|uniref:thymidylate kinase-like n=1 Tax=Teleopsis dalmanni TaxID=139649 RepID=UPI0018CEA4EF|nr:thymidylate kinase-like [Teleopsis dalmanni]